MPAKCAGQDKIVVLISTERNSIVAVRLRSLDTLCSVLDKIRILRYRDEHDFLRWFEIFVDSFVPIFLHNKFQKSRVKK